MSLDDWGNKLLELGYDRWHSRTGLTILIAGIVVVGVGIFAGIDITNVSGVEWAIIGTVVIGAWLWWLKTSIERAPRGRVGFGVAIEFENSEQANQLRADFVVTLRNLLNGSKHRHQFTFIEFPQSIAKRIADADKAVWLLNKARLHFLIHGRARVRPTPHGQAHVLDLSWVVRHRRIATEQSTQFAADAKAVFPGRLTLGPAGDMFVCELGAQLVDAFAGYVIGTAAAISNDFSYSEQLLRDAETKLTLYAKKAEGAPISVLLDRVRKRIAELYSESLARLSRQFIAKRDKSLLEQSEEIVQKLLTYQPDHYGANLSAAMTAFLLRHDVEGAKRALDPFRKRSDATWMYSDAFLIAYDGDLEHAYRTYRRAFESPLEDITVPVQCEEFIQVVIDEEPDRKWLYYCLGLINYRAKGDLNAARADFKRFIESVDPVRFKRQIEFAQKWVHEIDAALNATRPALGK